MTRAALERTVVAVKDVADQSTATYFVGIGGNWVGVESWRVLKNGATEFLDDEGRTILILPQRAPYILLRFDRLEFMSSELAERQHHKDQEDLAELHKELRSDDEGGTHPLLPGLSHGYL